MWRFDDGGSLVYDWQAKSYTITLPSGTVAIAVGGSSAVVTDSAITGKAEEIRLTGKITLNGDVVIKGSILTHNGLNVGSTHTHKGVTPGAGITGTPS